MARSLEPGAGKLQRRPGTPWSEWGAFALLGGAVLALILLIRGDSYWNFSDGVYLYSARALLHGAEPYTAFAAAQPPPIYYLGAGILALGDSITFARIALGLAGLATGATVLVAVRRLTGASRLALIAGVLALVTPRALHDSASLLPETFVAPLVMGAALLATRADRTWIAGAVAAVAVSIKLAYGLPAVAIALGAASRARYLLGLIGAGALLAAIFLVAFGSNLLDAAIHAQQQLGFTDLSKLPDAYGQAAWNLLPFAPPVLAAWLLRSRCLDRDLLGTLGLAAAGSVAVFVTVVKYGTDINLAVVAEPPLLALGAAGVAWAWDSRRAGELRSRGLALSAAAAVTLGTAQSLTLLASPADPVLFARPLSPSDRGWALSPSAVDAEIAKINRCPPGLAYSGDPYLAFLADRRMPGNQGDSFIITTKVNARFGELARTDRPRCPAVPATIRNSAILDRR